MALLSGSVNFKKDASFLDSFKSFEDNLIVKSTLSYSLSSNLMGQKVLDDQPVTAKVTRSILLLPERNRIKIELINQSLAELQSQKRILDRPRNPIGYTAPQYHLKTED